MAVSGIEIDRVNHLVKVDGSEVALTPTEFRIPSGLQMIRVNPDTMESRVCPGLHLIGEMLDVDGRIGGFNFQWAWSSAFVAGRALGIQPP